MFLGNTTNIGTARRLAARKTTVSIRFSHIAPQAKRVALVGDFNNWDTDANLFRRHNDGGWTVEVTLPHGHHRYLFVVDDEPILDPRATGQTRDEHDCVFSLIAVS